LRSINQRHSVRRSTGRSVSEDDLTVLLRVATTLSTHNRDTLGLETVLSWFYTRGASPTHKDAAR